MSDKPRPPSDRELKSLKPTQILAMGALIQFAEAMEEGDLTTHDLLEVMRLAIKEGSGMLMIQLTMAAHAASLLPEPGPQVTA